MLQHLIHHSIHGLSLAALSVSLILHLLGAGNALGQTQPAETESSDQAASAEKPEKETAKKPKLLAIQGGDIYTVTRGVIRNGTILVEDGKIKEVGQNVKIPDETTTIDATGKKISPGFVALSMTRVGLSSSAEGKYEDSLDPFDRNLEYCLGVGITTGCAQIIAGGRGRRFGSEIIEDFPTDQRFIGLDPDLMAAQNARQSLIADIGEYESLCECCGLPILPTEPIEPTRPSPIQPQKNVALKMSFGSLDGMLVEQDVFLDLTRGALVSAENQTLWRDQIAKARKYLEDKRAHEEAVAKGKKESPPRKPVSDAILKLVRGEAKLRISADSASEMRDLIKLSQELDYGLVLGGAAEAWLISEELARGGVAVMLTPRSRRSPNFGREDSSGSWIETPRVLEESGIPFAIATLSSSISLNGLAGRDLTSLPLEAAFAVRGGASEAQALAALTIHPASMMGLQDRIGSLEVGKDADILILDGNPMDYQTYVETAIVNGRIAYQRTDSRVLPVFER
jgi:imidazolonepropionase-like amidohydrolase